MGIATVAAFGILGRKHGHGIWHLRRTPTFGSYIQRASKQMQRRPLPPLSLLNNPAGGKDNTRSYYSYNGLAADPHLHSKPGKEEEWRRAEHIGGMSVSGVSAALDDSCC